jgi:hypothetical protein
MLPSWNQIGFDSLHYVAGLVAPLADGADGSQRSLVWVVGGRLDTSGAGGNVGRAGGNVDRTGGDIARAGGTATVVDPASELRFPLVLERHGELLTFHNYEGFKVNFVGSWDMPFGSWRLASRADAATGQIVAPAAFDAVALCDGIAFYGPFLKLMGMSDFATGRMVVAGATDLRRRPGGPVTFAPAEGATCSMTPTSATVRVPRLYRAGEHVYSLVLVDESSGLPAPLYYTKRTKVEVDDGGYVSAVRVEWDKGEATGPFKAYLMVDSYPVAILRASM